MQISVDVIKDNEIKKANAEEKDFFFFLVVPCCFKRFEKFRVMGRKKPLA